MIHSSLVVLHHDLKITCEILWLELYASRSRINFVTYYRPPNATVEDLQALNTVLATILSSLPLVLCGDFNVPDINWVTMTPSSNSLIAAWVPCAGLFVITF